MSRRSLLMRKLIGYDSADEPARAKKETKGYHTSQAGGLTSRLEKNSLFTKNRLPNYARRKRAKEARRKKA